MPNQDISDEERIERMAEAIFNTDEDIVDEKVADGVAAGDRSVMRRRSIRVRWELAPESQRQLYRRRARAARAAETYVDLALS